MNKHLHRIVFNRARGQLMVVQESASSVGGGASGVTSGAASGAAPGGASATARTSRRGFPQGLRAVAWSAMALLATGLGAWQPMAQAQVGIKPPQLLVADPNAPAGQRPILDAAQNGVPIVHIAPPSAAGVSRNQFSQFNVDAKGLILNNSATSVQTQLGGWIGGNPQLGYVPARIIVNEVIGPDASVLKGTIEVAGHRADVVIANPNGLLCDGCNFLNTGRATLSTGAPRYDAAGGLRGFDVRQGRLTVGPGGLNATNLEQLDLIARGMVIEGEVWAQNLHVLAGANQVLYASLGEVPPSTAQAGSGAAPRFAIDLKDLGGLYANQVYLIATEKGLGVNSTGRIAALQGNLQLSSNGDLTLKDAYAKQDLNLASAGNTLLTGQTQGAGATSLTSAGALTNQGSVDSSGPLAMRADVVANDGTVIGRATGAGAVSVQATTTFTNTGAIVSAGDLTATAQSLSLSGSQVLSGGALVLGATAGDLSVTRSQLNVGTSANLSASGRITQTNGLLQAQQDVALQASAIADIDSTVLARGALTLNTPGALDNTGGQLLGSAAVNLGAAQLVNDASATRQALIASDHSTQITTAGAPGVSNRGGVISAKTNLSVQTQGGALVNSGGIVVSDNALDVRAGAIESIGGQFVARAQSGGSLDLTGTSLNNTGGAINAVGALNITTSGALTNTAGGSIQAGTGVTLATQAFDNTLGTVISAAALSIDTAGQALTNRSGRLTGVGQVTVASGTLDNTEGRIGSGRHRVDINATAVDNSGGTISANTAANLDVTGGLVNAAGTIVADASTHVASASLDNSGGHILANAGDTTVFTTATTGRIVNDHGTIAGAHDATVTAHRSLSNRGGQVLAGRAVAVDAAGLDNTDGLVSAQTTGLALGASALDNTRGQLIGTNQLLLGSAGIMNAGGKIASGGALSIDTLGADLDNTRGTVQSTGALSVATAALKNDAGFVTSQTSLSINASGAIANTAGELSASRAASNPDATGQVAIMTAQGVDTSSGRIVAEGDLAIRASALKSATGTGLIAAGHDAAIHATTLANAGAVQAGNDLALDASAAIANSGSIVAGQDARITTASLANAGSSAMPATVAAGRDLAIAGGSLTNQQGTVQATRDLNARVDAVQNRGQVLAGGTLTLAGLTTANVGLDNSGGVVSAHGALAIGASTLANDSGRIDSAATTQISAGATSNRGGVITSTGGTVLKTQVVDNSTGEISSAAGLRLDTQGQRLANQGGRVISTQDLVLRSGAVDNSAAGTIGSSHGNLDVTAASLVNDTGKLSARQNLNAQIAGNVGNQGGSVTAGDAITLTAATVDNGQGRIVANQGTATVSAGQVSNAHGFISAAQAVDVTSSGQALDNTGGELTSDAAVTLRSRGLTNIDGTVSARATSLDVGTNAIDNTHGRLIGTDALQLTHGALTNRRGLISTSSALTLDTRGEALDNAQGRIVSAGQLGLRAGALVNRAGVIGVSGSGSATLAVASLDNTDGTLTAGTLGLASTGAVTNAGGSISAAQDATLTAQSLSNAASPAQTQRGAPVAGQVLAGRDLNLTASGALVNNAALIQAGRSATLQSADLSNDHGVLESHGTLGITAIGAASNRAGVIRTANASGASTATALDLRAASFDNTGGTLNAATALTVSTPGALLNAGGGVLQASGGTLRLDAGATDNRAGVIASAADLIANAGAFDNTGGAVSARADLLLDTRGATLTNQADGTRDATILAGGNATLRAGVLSNLSLGAKHATLAAQNLSATAVNATNSGNIAAGGTPGVDGQLNVTTSGALLNDGGSLTVQGSLGVQAQSLSNQGGRIVAASSTGATAPALSINTLGSIDNGRGGLIAAREGDATVNTHGGAFANTAGGTLHAARNLTLTAGATDNSQGGSLQAGAVLSATTQALNNTAGLVAAAGRLDVAASGAIDNSAGTLSGTSGATVAANGQTFTNTAGSLKSAQGDVRLTVATAHNDGGSIAAAGTTTIDASVALSNRALGAIAGKIDGRDIEIATGSLDNTGGHIAADRDATLVTARTDNTNGQISAKRDLTLIAPTLVNTNGQIIADNALTVTTASNAFGGTLSGRDLTLNIQGDYTNTSRLAASHNLTIAANNVSNSGTLSAGNTLGVSASGGLSNNATGELSGANVVLSAGGTLDNQGLVNSTAAGGRASVQAASIHNGGRVYGDNVDVQGAQIVNDGTGVIAARQTLNLAGQDIANNGANALLLSLGDANVGATLDPSTRVVGGSANRFANTAGRVEADGNLVVSAATLLNANGGVQTRLATLAAIPQTTLVMPSGTTTQYPLSQCRGVAEGWDQPFCIVHPDLYGQRQDLAAAWDTTTVGNPDQGFTSTTTPHYTWNDPVFARLHVTAMSGPRPSEPGGAGGCSSTDPYSGNVTAVNSPACNQWNADAAAWDNAYATVSNNLQSAINGYNASVDADNATVAFEDYTVINATSTTQRTQVTASAPGKLLAGGNLILNGSSITNTDSQIVAGGLVYVNGQGSVTGTTPVTANVQNIATPGQQIVTVGGTSQFSHLDADGWFGGHTRNTDGAQPYAPAPITTTFDLPTIVFQQNASQLQGGIAQATGSAIPAVAASGALGVLNTGIGAITALAGPLASNIALNPATAATAQAATGGSASASTVTAAAAATLTAGNLASGPISAVTIQPTAQAPANAAATGAPPASAAAAATRTITLPTVLRYAVSGADQRARDVVLTIVPNLSLPKNQLFKINPTPGASYLVETDPAFTNYRSFLGSEYFEQQLGLDPQRTWKRYGDGYEEQRLINDQILALTGRRYLSGSTDTETEYKALMDAGVAFAKAYQLTPGVALSAEQMALLSTDIVWLTTQSVTLADGSTAQVLVPQVYLRRPDSGDLGAGGALIAGSSVVIKTPGELVNSGSLQADSLSARANDLTNTGRIAAKQDLLLSASNDLKNLSGSISTERGLVSLTAGRDIVLQTRTVDTSLDASTSGGTSSSTRTSIDRIASVQAGGDLLISAGRDLSVQGAKLDAGQNLQATAGRDLTVSAVQGSYQFTSFDASGTSMQGRSAYLSEAATTQQASNLTAGRNVSLVAGTDPSQTADDAKTPTGTLKLDGSNVSAARDIVLQGNNASISAAKASQSIDSQTVQARSYDRAANSNQTLVGGNVTAGNNLTLNASAGNLTATGATLTATTGQAALIASGDVTIQAATTQHSTASESAYQYSGGISGLYAKSEQSKSEHSTQSSQVQSSNVSGNSVVIQAGDAAKQTGDIKLLASNIASTGATSLSAGRDVIVDTVNQSESRRDAESSTSSFELGNHAVNQIVAKASNSFNRVADPILGSRLPPPPSGAAKTETSQGTTTSEQAVGSSISVDSLSVSAGRDALIRGSAVVTTGDLAINAGRNLEILTSRNSQQAQDSRDRTDSGLFTAGGALSNGTRQTSQTSNGTVSAATASQVASLSGIVALQAGETYRQSGSQVLALGQGPNGQPGTGQTGDIDITAKRVVIDPARTTSQSGETTHFKQEGINISLGGPVVSAVQSIAQSQSNADKTSDSRMQALAAATAAMSAYDAAGAVGKAAASGNATDAVGISADLVHVQSQTKSTQRSDTVSASTLSAARDIRITASGAGNDSGISVIGSDVSAGRNASLKAEGAIELQAASSTESLRQSNSNQSANVGVTFGGGSQNGLSIHAGASAGTGKAVGDDQSQRNTHIAAGNQIEIKSGGDTTLQGAVVAANTVKADIGGKLNIQSLQDSTSYDARQQSAGFSVSLCIPPICYGETVSVSASAAKARVIGDFAGVVEQSGIKAGDGGFQITVGGNTELKGGVISSSQAAIDANKNSLSTATIATSDIANKDKFDASGYSVSGSSSGGGSVGISSKSGDQSSVTRSGVSQGTIAITDDKAQQRLTGKDAAATLATLDTKVTTDSATAGTIQRAWDGQQQLEQTQANVAITAAFGSRAAKAVGDVAASQTKPYSDAQRYADLSGRSNLSDNERAALAQLSNDGMTADKAQATLADPRAKENYEHWKEGGDYRVAAHAVVGALTTGSLQGVVGAGSAAVAAPQINEAMQSLDAPAGVKAAVGAALAGAIGAVASAGSAAGVTTAVNSDLNNRQLHPQEINWIASNAKRFADKLSQELGRPVSDIEAMQWLTYAGESNVDNAMQRSNGNFVRGTANLSETQAYDAAKAFIATQAKDAFVDERGQGQQLFTAKNGEFYKPEVYSQWANNKDYRDYYWSVQGINLKPDNPTPQEQALYDQRQVQVNAAMVKQLITAGVVVAGSAVAVKVANAISSGAKTSAAEFTPDLNKPTLPAKVDGNFETLGIQRDPLTFPEGVKMVNQLVSEGLPPVKAIERANEFITSGSTLPIATALDVTDKLVKVVPAGGQPSTTTGYWMRESELATLQSDPASIASKLGLPPGMQVDAFDVFQITPRQGAVVFESTIAPTTVNGVPNTTGGATQTIVVDRNQFTPPVKTGTIVVKKEG
jgi:filamentous hemagglutinin